ncbi:MAG: hypothetical protein J6R33_02390 [Clostridia bacterium]|nr:hypothetical protein [Clostridia bacterium]
MKRRMIRTLALALCMLVFLTSSYQVTFGYIVEKTDSLINIFKPFVVAQADLQIKKTVEHPFGEDYAIPDTVAFDFAVELGALYANTTVATSAGPMVADDTGRLTVSVKPNIVFGIEGLDAGTKVTVRELEKADDGFTAKDGKAEQEVMIAEGQTVAAEFVNVYEPQAVNLGDISLVVNKVLEGREWQEGDSFAATLDWDQGKGEWLTLGTKRAGGQKLDMSAYLDDITIGTAGAYAFRITEVMEVRDHIEYDTTVNTVTVDVTDRDMDGALEIGKVDGAPNVSVTGAYAVNVVFTNVYVAPTEVTIQIEKTVDGTAIGPEGFRFMLEGEGLEELATTDEDGKAVMVLPYSLADDGKAYRYTLREVNDGQANVIYDERVYEITVSLTKEATGMVAAVTVDGEAVEDVVSVRFRNGYQAPEEDSPSTGSDRYMWVWFMLMFMSGTGIFLLLLREPKYQRKH